MSNPDVKIQKFFLILSRTKPNYYFYNTRLIFFKWFIKVLEQFGDLLINPFQILKGRSGKVRRGPAWCQVLFGRFGLVGLVGKIWFGELGLVGFVWQVLFGRFGLGGLVWEVWFGLVGLVWQVWFGRFDLVGLVCRFGLVDLVWFGLVWFSQVWFGLVWFGLVGLVWYEDAIKKARLP